MQMNRQEIQVCQNESEKFIVKKYKQNWNYNKRTNNKIFLAGNMPVLWEGICSGYLLCLQKKAGAFEN